MTEILSQLTAVERKVLPHISSLSKAVELTKKTGLKEIEVQRALQWLSNKKLVQLEKQEEEIINIDVNGEKYIKKGLPEKTFLKEILNGQKNIQDLAKTLEKEEINACIGLLKGKGAIETLPGPTFKITEQGKKEIKNQTPEEKLLLGKFPIHEKTLSPELKVALSNLLKRKNILKKDKKTEWTATLTDLGKKILKETSKTKEHHEERLTAEMIRTGSWKNKKFRAFDINSKVPSISVGRKHFVNEAIEYIKSIWLELGFEEMQGNVVQSAFWDLDSLFVPQDHPAREMQDTFYIEGKAKLPKPLFEKVKKVHENGGDTGSKGWQTPYSKEIAEEILLRTHTTVISAHTLSKLKKEDLPKKFFIVGKVFRNEALDWKHLFEFNQVDGIVVDPEGSMAKLKGYLKEFFSKMGYTDVRIRPAHFPYTEPSAEVEAFHPVKKEWVEMGGCGIFRPEVTKTLLGFECPVLAWGLGMERIIVSYYKINDLRELYKNDLKQIKEAKIFMK